MVFKEQFFAFKQSEVYKEFDNLVREQIGNLAAELVNREYPNDMRDQYVRGAIQAYKGMLEWTPDFIDEEVEEEADDN
jgi:hypothetical protein